VVSEKTLILNTAKDDFTKTRIVYSSKITITEAEFNENMVYGTPCLS
jgi:hypothetical protein